ncbi:MAG: L,D-transpeptidase [Candidatus Paceibacterota bacterium]
MKHFTPGYITLSFLFVLLFISSAWYLFTPNIGEAEIHTEPQSEVIIPAPQHVGNYVLIHLDSMTLDLRDGTTTLATIPLVSQGKPGSYYETIGGSYVSDYKEALHFSSIGHVYMPYSVHLFGNYFIHGIPYYPDGTKVSSTYSGGCIRLEDDDARRVYDFITRGMPIIITRGGDDDFSPSATTTPTISSDVMTRLMVATISLEFLTQDNEILSMDGISTTTRKTLIPQLFSGDTEVNKLYAQALGEKAFTEQMNKKAHIIGLTNTTFTDTTHDAMTTPEDYERFMKYIETYKSYLLVGQVRG